MNKKGLKVKSQKRIIAALVAILLMLSIIPNYSDNNKVYAAGSGKTLNVNWSNIAAVGNQQQGSEACWCFALAYARTMLDGKVHSWAEYDEYGGSNQYNCAANIYKADFSRHVVYSSNEVYKGLYDSINNNRPVIVNVSGYRTSDHFVCVVGYENVSNPNQLTASNFLIIDSCWFCSKSCAENMASAGYSALYDGGYHYYTPNSGSVNSTAKAISRVPLNLGTDFNAVIRSSSTKKVLTASKSTQQQVFMDTYNSKDLQKSLWNFKRNSDGSYTIKSLYNNEYLDVKAGSTNNGTIIWTYPVNNGSPAQKWFITRSSSGSLCLRPGFDNADSALDLGGGSLNSGAYLVHLWDFSANGTNTNQQFLIEKESNLGINNSDFPSISYQVHIEGDGWLNTVSDGALAGTQGQSKRIEAIIIDLTSNGASMVQYRSHVEDDGWQTWKNSGQTSGTVGQAKRLEAIEIKLNEAFALKYDIYYRTYVEGIGWQEWKKNGETSGTTGQAKRIESIEIKLSKKEKQLTNIAVTTHPFKTEYIKGEEINLNGMIVNASFDDGSNETVSDYNITYSDLDSENAFITISYKGKTTTQALTVHTPSNSFEIETPATCTASGTQVIKCKNCGKVLEREDIPATGHSWNNGIVTVNPTETTTGIKTYTCENCGKTKTEEIPCLTSVSNNDTYKEDIYTDNTKPSEPEKTSIAPSTQFAEYNGYIFYTDDNGEIRCNAPDGTPIINDFKCDGTYTYYFQADGTAMRSRLTYHPDGEHIIYFDENGHEVFSDFANVKKTITGDSVNDYCFFDVYGYMYVDVLTYDKTGTFLYYANPCGVIEAGCFVQFSATVKWADGTPCEGIAGNYGYIKSDCTLLTNTKITDWAGRICYIQANGVIVY